MEKKDATINDVLEVVKGLATKSDISVLAANTEKSINDVLEAVNEFATKTENRFVSIEGKIGTMQSDIGTMQSDIGTMQSDIGIMQSTMVTKDFLTEKLADLRGDLVVLTRKEDRKLVALIALLRGKHLIEDNEAKSLLEMEPFPELHISR